MSGKKVFHKMYLCSRKVTKEASSGQDKSPKWSHIVQWVEFPYAYPKWSHIVQWVEFPYAYRSCLGQSSRSPVKHHIPNISAFFFVEWHKTIVCCINIHFSPLLLRLKEMYVYEITLIPPNGWLCCCLHQESLGGFFSIITDNLHKSEVMMIFYEQTWVEFKIISKYDLSEN
jgi:hypothetical protein